MVTIPPIQMVILGMVYDCFNHLMVNTIQYCITTRLYVNKELVNNTTGGMVNTSQ